MGCCNNQTDEREVPDGVDPCCNIRGRRCMCLPYDDPFMITSMILSIVATFVSWVWWVTWLVSLIGMIVFQVLWCSRMPSGGLYGPVVISGATSLASLAVAIYVLVAFRKKSDCYAFVLYADDYRWLDDDSYRWPNRDYCPEKAWFIVALICSLLWGAAAGCTFWFIKSGRHAKWEEKHTPTIAADVELAVSSRAIPEEPVVTGAAILECEKEDIVE